MIEFKQVSKQYEDMEAIHRLDLSIETGSIFGLLGSNGAGNIVKNARRDSRSRRGDILIDQDSVFENNSLKDHCFLIPDTPYFFSNYTISQMACFYSRVYSRWNEKKYIQLLDVFQIPVHKKIHRLSKGMQRQVAFWLALSTMPEVLILDEPFDGLDPVMRQNVRQLLIQDVADRNMTIVISSHNLREIEDLADHVAIIHRGKLLLEKDVDDLKADVHKVQFAFKDKIPTGLYRGLDILNKEKRGSVVICIVKGQVS